MKTHLLLIFVFFFNDTATTEIYTLSLHDALPILDAPVTNAAGNRIIGPAPYVADFFWSSDTNSTSDKHTAELLSPAHLVYPLLRGRNFFGGTKTLPTQQLIFAQVRVWDTAYVATY